MPKTSNLKNLMTDLNKNIGLHIGLILAAVVLSLGFYFPVLQGKVLQQSDIVQYEAMSRQLKEHRANTSTETYWIDNAFGGMPTYQLGAEYAYDFLAGIHQLTRILPRPAHTLFLYVVGAYFLAIICGISFPIALLMAVAYGFSTYLLIILQVGHNTKALALAYMPFVFGGWILLHQRKWFWGFLISSLALGMNIKANHYQMTYYMLMLLGMFMLVYIVKGLRQKQAFKTVWTPIGLWVVAFLLALGFNAPPLMATAEYTQFSTRGASELTLNLDGSPKEQGSSGLDYDYITQYSYGIFESLNLLSPQIQGGASGESLGMDSALGKALIQAGVPQNQARGFLQSAPTYWGDQPILEAPAYLGATVLFLFFLSLWVYKGPYKLPLGIGICLALMLSWGKNFPILTQLFIDYFPLYNKFRAVSSIQVLLALSIPWMAALGLQSYFSLSEKDQKKTLKVISIAFFSALGLLWLIKGMLSFSGASDGYYRQVLGDGLMSALMQSRQELYDASLWRTFLFSGLVALTLFWIHFKPHQKTKGLVLLVLLVFADLYGVIDRYSRPELFVSPRQRSQNFRLTAADRAILEDSSRYRVYEPRLGLSQARTANFHLAIGGYHGAKPRRFEELISRMESKQLSEVLNFLNVKYVIQEDENGLQAIGNPTALGNAWAVDSLRLVSSADLLMEQLQNFNAKELALGISSETPSDLVFEPADSLTQIQWTGGAPDELEYDFQSPKSQLVVFSEMYYAPGWKSYIDDTEVPHFCVDYVLRAMVVPAGKHQIRFVFDPPVVATGEGIRLGSYVFWVVLLFGVYRFQKSED